jgi:alpha/beta superfamily hydrolase
MLKTFVVKFLLLAVSFSLLITTAIAQMPQATTKTKKTLNEVTLLTDGTLKLVGDYYQGKKIKNKFSGGVLLLHDCNANRSVYKHLASVLSAAGLHVLSLDFRGYGGSQNEAFSQVKIRRAAKNIQAYQAAIAGLNAYWEKDTLAAFNWLRNKVNNRKQIAVVSVGCSASYAVAIAEKMHVNSLVMVTPTMTYSAKERYKNLADSPTYFISAIHQVESYKIAHELFLWSGSRRSKMQTFKDNSIGHILMRHQKGLDEDIARWLQQNLK